MSFLLAIMSYPAGTPTLGRHWDYFKRAGADELYVIGTWEQKDKPDPKEAGYWCIGENKYIWAEHLPNRLLDTLEAMLSLGRHEFIMIAEYDTLFLNPIPIEQMSMRVAAHYAGMKDKGIAFYHNPWLFKKDFAQDFIEEGRKVVAEDICKYNTAESSPDVFFGLVCARLGEPVQTDLWIEYSRNSLDVPGHLEEARLAFQEGYDVIHGIKTAAELEFITT